MKRRDPGMQKTPRRGEQHIYEERGAGPARRRPEGDNNGGQWRTSGPHRVWGCPPIHSGEELAECILPECGEIPPLGLRREQMEEAWLRCPRPVGFPEKWDAFPSWLSWEMAKGLLWRECGPAEWTGVWRMGALWRALCGRKEKTKCQTIRAREEFPNRGACRDERTGVVLVISWGLGFAAGK